MSNKNLSEVIIIGGGIAAHTAALYTARAELKPIVLSAVAPDQLSLTTLVENFPGFPEGVLGPELVANAKKQAEKFGANYVSAEATAFEIKKDFFEITAGGETYQGLCVVIATGASARRLNIAGEDKYFGRGVSTCATCDAAFYRDREAVVVGGGDSAMEEALALYKFAKKVTIIHRRNEFKASKIMRDRVLSLKDKIEIIWGAEVTEVLGDGKLVTGLKLKNLKTEEASEIKTNGLFLAIGHVPNTKIFAGKIELDDLGYITTDKKAKTNVPGVFAGGDVADHYFRQAITSAGSGCQAAMEAERYIEKLKAGNK